MRTETVISPASEHNRVQRRIGTGIKRQVDYFDAIRGRVRYPVSDAILRKIGRHCASADQHYFSKLLPNDRLQRIRWYWYLSVVRPNPTCIRLLLARW